MALNGSFSGKTSNQFVKPTITWQAVQDNLENYSDVTVELRYSRTNTGYTTEGNFHGALYIDKDLPSEQKQSGSKTALKITYKSNSLAMRHTFRVYHDNSGAKKITIAATGYLSGTSVESTTISQEVVLDTIPRASDIGAADANVGAVTTVVVTKKNAAYSHSIAYRFGELSGFLKADGSTSEEKVIFSQSNVAFRLPEDFYGQIPDAKSGKCMLECVTYYDGAQVGDGKTTEFTVTAAESLCAPSVSAQVTDFASATLALTGDENKLVRYHSIAKCDLSAQGKHGATIVSKTVNGSAMEESLQIPQVESGSFTFTVKDSRGYGSTAAVTKELIPYVPLTVNASVKRTDPTSGQAVVKVEGNCYNGSFGAAQNTLSLFCRVGSGEDMVMTVTQNADRYAATMTLEGLDYETSHSVTVWALDLLERVSTTVTVQKGMPVFDWGEKDFQFHVPVLDRYGTPMASGVATSSDNANPNTTLNEWVLTNHTNGPVSSHLFYIHTVFTSAKSVDASRLQFAQSYGEGGVYYRAYSDGVWSGWEKLANASDIQIGTIPIEKGGTGAETPAEARLNLGTNMVKLWENLSPASTFAAQSISISGEDYDCYCVVPHASINTDATTFLPWTICYKGKEGRLIGLPNNKTARRVFSVNSAGTSVTFKATEYCKSSYGSAVTENDYIVPMYIFGMYITEP